MGELAKIQSWHKDIALIETIEEAKLIKDAAETYQIFIQKQKGIHKGKSDEIGEYIIDLECFEAEWLEKNYPGNNGRMGTKREPIKMPVPKKESARARKLNNLKKEKPNEFKEFISHIKEDKDVVLNAKTLFNELNRAEKLKEQEEKNKILKEKEIAPLTGKFDVIVIDPPWPMEKIEREVRPNQIGFDYPVMNENELSEIQIPCEDNCHIWLWTTHRFLPMAFRLLEKWGLKYVCTFVWHKPGGFQPVGLPQYNCEFALYARHGSPKFIDTKDFPVCFIASRGNHSEKPEEFYKTLVRVTSGHRLDMFNRRKIPGFKGWGKEAENE
jgi:N6-adenosine-specific RNA methylase IME4